MNNTKDNFKEYLERKKEETRQSYETGLFAYCQEHNHRYIEADGNAEERAALEREYREYCDHASDRENEEARESVKKARIDAEIRHFFDVVPPRFKDADISQLNMGEKAKNLCSGCSGLLLGTNGPGKTYFIWAVVREWAKKGESFAVCKAQRLLSDIKRQDDPYGYIEHRFKKVSHLVIDEIDKIFESKADYVYLNYLIDMRYEYLLQTFVVGNGDRETFVSTLGQSIFSRLVGDGGVFIYHNGEDKRLIGRKFGA